VHLLDLRYYRASAARYAADNGIDRILVLYSVPNFVADRNLVFLGAVGEKPRNSSVFSAKRPRRFHGPARFVFARCRRQGGGARSGEEETFSPAQGSLLTRRRFSPTMEGEYKRGFGEQT
jgi:hypothetical protein